MKYILCAITVVLALSLVSVGHTGEKYHWYIIKGKDGVCKVIQAEQKTPATIAGPYKTRENAQAAKEEKCSTKKKSTKRSSAKKADPITSEIDKALKKTRKKLLRDLK